MTKPLASLSTLMLGLGLGLGLGLTSCTGSRPNPDHCWRAEGDATCVERYGAERPFCTAPGCEGIDDNYGCVTERPATDECYSPCGGEMTILDDDSCLGTADESTGTGSESGSESASETTGPGPCESNAECPSETPICNDVGECVGCADASEPDAACAELSAALPVCDVEANACVQCLPGNASACTGVTPLCDEASSSCFGCAWHEQCPEACSMKTGACLASNVFEASTLAELQQAIDEIAALQPAQGVVYLQGTLTLTSVSVPDGVEVAILGALGQAVPTWTGANGSPALTIESGAVVYVQGVRIAGTQGNALGIEVGGGELWLDRSSVVGNTGGGLLVTGGAAVVRNAFVGGNIADVKAIEVVDGQLTLAFSTVIAGNIGLVDPAALACGGASEVSVRNSILAALSAAPEVTCAGATIETSVLEDASMFPDNAMMTFAPATWPGAAALGNGDFSLNGSQPAVIDDAAIWQPGDPLVDLAGDPRPQDQTPTAAGADLP